MGVVPVFVILLFFGFAGWSIWYQSVQARRSRENLQRLAVALGFNYIEGKKGVFAATPPHVNGILDGREVALLTFITGSGKSRQEWRAVEVKPARAGRLMFNLRPDGMLIKIGTLLGYKEAQVGDENFDKAWFLETNDPEFLGAALVPEIREQLTAARSSARPGFHFRLKDGVVRYFERGAFAKEQDLLRFQSYLPVLQSLAAIAEVYTDSKQ